MKNEWGVRKRMLYIPTSRRPQALIEALPLLRGSPLGGRELFPTAVAPHVPHTGAWTSKEGVNLTPSPKALRGAILGVSGALWASVARTVKPRWSR